MISISFEDFQEPFDANEFVERLASVVEGGGTKGGAEHFDPQRLHEVFEKTINELKDLDEKTQLRVDKLEEFCAKEEKVHKKNACTLEEEYKNSTVIFQELDDRINYVATKVVHLGDQLEGINNPRSRAMETRELMNYFEEFLSEEGSISPVFTDPEKIHEAAGIVQKLVMISQELPSDKFHDVKERIQKFHTQTEEELINKFKEAYIAGDVTEMKGCAETLLGQQGHNQCIQAFIDQSQKGQFMSNDVFEDVVRLCERVHEPVRQVFGINAEMVMGKLVQNMYEGVLKTHVDRQLKGRNVEKEMFLGNLQKLYGKTKELGKKLSEFKLGSDSNFLDRLKKHLYSDFLPSYLSMELDFLNEKSSLILQKYYDSIGHQKKERTASTSAGINELISHEIQKRIPGRSHTSSDLFRETLLDQNVAVTLLQDNKNALRRAELLTSPSELPSVVLKIYEVLLNHLCIEHMDYALDQALQALPPLEPRSPPEIGFFEVLDQANGMFHLLEKHFSDIIIRLVGSSPVYTECVMQKKRVTELMESKLDTGLDRVLTSIINYLRFLLNTEQKKSDFRPEEAGIEVPLMNYTPACHKCCQFIRNQLNAINESLDGKNLETVLTDLGIRIHRLLFEHLQLFTYSSMGGMMAICDINEYRKCMKDFKVPVIETLFNTLHALGNLLVVAPDNLKQVCSGEQLAVLDKGVLQSFVQLRQDYKTAKLSRHFT